MRKKHKEVRVLIVDGNKKERESLSYLVTVATKQCDFQGEVQTFTVEDQNSALSVIEKVAGTFDFALVGIQCNPENLEEKDGYGVVSLIKERIPDCVVFMTTALPMTELLYGEIIASGADEFLESPVDLKKLHSKMERFFN